MRRIAFVMASTLVLACSPKSETRSQTRAAPMPQPEPMAPLADKSDVEADSSAYFAGGCFWGVEHYLEQLDGVLSVESGYMGGTVANPTYEDVLTKKSGHYETVRVRYDSAKVDYETVAKLFFEIHDPTQDDGQGPDIGPQYRSAIFVQSPQERETIENLITVLKQRGYDVVTEIRDGAAKFWPAEDYHQDYYVRTGKTPYCHAKVDRFGDG